MLEPVPKLINDRYEVLGFLGQGAFGEVYLVKDIELGVVQCLKTVSEFSIADIHLVNELRKLERIDSPYVIRTFGPCELLEDGTGVKGVLTEYFEGQTLEEHLQNPIGLLDKLLILKSVACGLRDCHRVGVLHRDLAPSNILIDRRDNIRIIDFGKAMDAVPSREETRAEIESTDNGQLLFCAPEQFRGINDERSDIYSFGILFFYVITGKFCSTNFLCH